MQARHFGLPQRVRSTCAHAGLPERLLLPNSSSINQRNAINALCNLKHMYSFSTESLQGRTVTNAGCQATAHFHTSQSRQAEFKNNTINPS